LPIKVKRLCVVAGLPVHIRKIGKARREIALPLRVGGVGFREALDDGAAVLVGFQRPGKINLCLLHVANLSVGVREITLPARIPGVGFRQPLGDGEAVLVGFQRGGKIVLRPDERL
jgi:hypothetical protein